jgi:hypothetical protein
MKAMTAEALKALLKRRPFVPFKIKMSDGTSYDILHPDMVLVTRNWANIGVWQKGKPGEDIPDTEAFLSFLHIAAVEDLQRREPAA